MLKLIAGMMIILGFGLYFGIMEFGTVHSITFTIASKDDQPTGSGHQYMIFTTENHALLDKDAFWHGKNDSSLVWVELHTGVTYTCPVYGWRRFWPTSYMDILDGCKPDPAGVKLTY